MTLKSEKVNRRQLIYSISVNYRNKMKLDELSTMVSIFFSATSQHLSISYVKAFQLNKTAVFTLVKMEKIKRKISHVRYYLSFFPCIIGKSKWLWPKCETKITHNAHAMLIYNFVWKTNLQSANAFDIDFFFLWKHGSSYWIAVKTPQRKLSLPYIEYTRNFSSNF